MNGDINLLEVAREPEIARLLLLNSKCFNVSTPLIHEMSGLLFLWMVKLALGEQSRKHPPGCTA